MSHENHIRLWIFCNRWSRWDTLKKQFFRPIFRVVTTMWKTLWSWLKLGWCSHWPSFCHFWGSRHLSKHAMHSSISLSVKPNSLFNYFHVIWHTSSARYSRMKFMSSACMHLVSIVRTQHLKVCWYFGIVVVVNLSKSLIHVRLPGILATHQNNRMSSHFNMYKTIQLEPTPACLYNINSISHMSIFLQQIMYTFNQISSIITEPA